MISLLFLSCKRFHFLERTVASIREHLRDVEPSIPVQYLCFDNGSAPADQQRILNLGLDLVQVSGTNLGIGPAMNRLVAAVRTPYVLNLQDDWVIRNPNRIRFLAEGIQILESDRRIAHLKLDTCHFLDFTNKQVYDGPFTVAGSQTPFYVQNPTMLWGGFSFPPALTRTQALHQIGPFLEEQPFRRGWAESEFSGRFTKHFVAAKSPHLLLFDHIGGEQASPGWADQGKTESPASPAHPPTSPVSLQDILAPLRQAGLRDRQALEQRLPRLATSDDLPEADQRLFEQIHHAYCSSVSTAVMAASLEAIRFVCRMILSTKATTVADLGSGLSSVLLRLFVRTHAPQVVITTADSDPEWLRKTREFIAQQGLPVDNLLLWEELRTSGKRFDLIFYDLGHVHDLRARCLGEVLAMTTPTGVVIADDIHFAAYRHQVEQIAAEAGRHVYNAISYTEDEFHRFSAVITPPTATAALVGASQG